MPSPAKTPDPLLHSFGLAVRRRREEHGWSLDVLADKTGLSRTMLIGIEHGRRNPSLRVVVALAEALGCPAGELVGEAVSS